ncbi:MAG: HAMP domain-containing histidine kinase [Arcobacter sp.]|nr:HAMP domain-containing histidine kinase [Arcobacter sp.]
MTLENKVLLRQLKKLKIDDFSSFDEVKFNKFLHVVEETYNNMDFNLYRLELALDISTKELRDFNDTLEDKITSEVNKNREKDQKLLMQSRYAGMGEMIGNIAHQWRQPLSAISSTASGTSVQIELGLLSKEEIITRMSQIMSYTQFLNQTIEDFRGYLALDKEKKEFDLFEILLLTLGIIGVTYKDKHIKIYMRDKNFTSKSFGFSNELSQVFLNIFNNARDALLEHSAEIDRRVYVDIDEDENYNIVKIIDNAGGIPEHIMNKIFDPYFTTKHQSQGTGIGLYMSKDIVEKNMNGELIAENINTIINEISYNGACFTISIPKFKD